MEMNALIVRLFPPSAIFRYYYYYENRTHGTQIKKRKVKKYTKYTDKNR